MLGHVTRAQQPLVSGAIRGIFTADQARERLGQVADQLRPHAPKVTALLEDAEAELLRSTRFRLSTGQCCAPPTRWSGSTARSAGVRTSRDFPNDTALLRLAGMLLLEQNDEWLVGRRYFSESSLALLMTRDRPDHPTAPHDRELPQLTAS